MSSESALLLHPPLLPVGNAFGQIVHDSGPATGAPHPLNNAFPVKAELLRVGTRLRSCERLVTPTGVTEGAERSSNTGNCSEVKLVP